MAGQHQIRTVWGPTGAQKVMARVLERQKAISEEQRQQAGKYLSSASYGTPVPIGLGRIRVSAPLIGWDPGVKRALYLAGEGETTLGPVAYNNGEPVPIAQDPAKYLPGTDTQDLPTNTDDQQPDYLGRAVAWRTLGESDGDRPPSLSFEIGGVAVDDLQRVVLHDVGPVATNQDPLDYQADSLIRGDEVHACWVRKIGATWSIYYARSLDQGVTWGAAVAAVSGLAQGILTPALFALPAGAVHIAYFAQNGTTVEVRDAYSSDGATWSTRSVATITAAQRPGLAGGTHLSASAAGGRLWIAWQCDPLGASRGIDMAATTADTGAATWVRPPATYTGIAGRELRLGLGATFNLDPVRVRTPSIAAISDGSAALAFASNALQVALYVKPCRVNAGQIEWSSGTIAGDPGGLDVGAMNVGKWYPVLWDGATEPPAPGTGRARGAALRLVWLGSLGFPGHTDCWALVYRVGGQTPAAVGWTPYRCRIGALSATAGQEFELDIEPEDLVYLPKAAVVGSELRLSGVKRSQVLEGYQPTQWLGDVAAKLWRVDFRDRPRIKLLGIYESIVSGGERQVNGFSLDACPTHSGLIVHEWADFELGDSGSLGGKRSRLTAWNPSIEAIGDLDPSIIFRQLVTHPRYGAWPAFEEFIGDTANLDAYTQAMGFLFSERLDSQVNIWQHLTEMMGSANCEALWTGGTLEWVPIEALTVSGNGTTYTPKPEHQAPVYHLTEADFRGSLRSSRRPVSQEKNVFPLSYSDRARNYSTTTIEVRDPGGVALRGEQKASTVDCPWITRRAVANLSAWVRLRRERAAPDAWEFDLTARYARLDAGDLVSLTDAQVGLDHVVCRVRKIVQHRDGSLSVTVENAGLEFAAPVSPIASEGDLSTPIWYAPSILPPAIVAMPVEYRGFSVVLIAAAGLPGWAGCDIYRSWDGEEWAKIGEILASSPVGTLKAPMGNLAPRPGLRPHPGLRPGLQDDWVADLSMVQQTVPAPGTAYTVPQPPALALIGSELVAHWERANSAGWESAGATLKRGAWGTAAQASHAASEPIAILTSAAFEWQRPDGSGMLYLRFPTRGWGGAMAQPLEFATTYTVEVPA